MNQLKVIFLACFLVVVSLPTHSQNSCNADFGVIKYSDFKMLFFDSSYVDSNNLLQSLWQVNFVSSTITVSGVNYLFQCQYAGLPQDYNICHIIETNSGCIDTVCRQVVYNGCSMPGTVVHTSAGINTAVTSSEFDSIACVWVTYPPTTQYNSQSITIPNPVDTVALYIGSFPDACEYVQPGPVPGNHPVYGAQPGCPNLEVSVIPDTAIRKAVAMVSGGTPPYNYAWSSTATTDRDTVIYPGVYRVTVTDQNGCHASGAYVHPLNGWERDVYICGRLFHDNNINGYYDAGDSAVSIYSSFASIAVYNTEIQYILRPDTSGFFEGYVTPGQYSIRALPSPYIASNFQINNFYYANGDTSFNVVSGDSLCGFNFGIMPQSAPVCGRIYFDINGDGLYQNTEPDVNAHVQLTDSNTVGFYLYYGSQFVFYPPNGTDTLSIIHVGITSGLNPSSGYEVPLSIPNPAYCPMNFPFSQNYSDDIGLQFTAVSNMYFYSVIENFKTINFGNAPADYELLLTYDSLLTPVYYGNGVLNSANHTLQFSIINHQPGQTLYTSVMHNSPGNLPIGTQFHSSAYLTPVNGSIDLNPLNDTANHAFTYYGPYDPNNKLCEKSNGPTVFTMFPEAINPDLELQYVINFQNTGNAPSINVLVIDTISSLLNIDSYEFIEASHGCYIQQEGNVFKYYFPNILLPDSNANEPESHGNIRFKIKAFNTIAPGDLISDHASIYFDYNDPVITNDATLQVILPVGNQKPVERKLNVLPNPANTQLTISLNELSMIENLELFSLDGRLIEVFPIKKNKSVEQLYVGHIPQGIFVLKAKTSRQIYSTRIALIR